MCKFYLTNSSIMCIWLGAGEVFDKDMYAATILVIATTTVFTHLPCGHL